MPNEHAAQSYSPPHGGYVRKVESDSLASSRDKELSSGSVSAPADKMDRGCGLLRMARVRSEMSLFYRPACNSKSCPHCRDKVLNRWMERIPEDLTLYGAVVTRERWDALKSQLARARRSGDDGDYAHLPIADNLVLVFSDAPIGDPIDHTEIRDALDYTESEFGRLITSKAWRKKAAPVKADPGSFRDEGVCRSSWQWIKGKADQLQLPETHHKARERGYTTSEAQHEIMVAVASPVSEADYYAQRTARMTDAEWSDVDEETEAEAI